jgi:hypothetical protein
MPLASTASAVMVPSGFKLGVGEAAVVAATSVLVTADGFGDVGGNDIWGDGDALDTEVGLVDAMGSVVAAVGEGDADAAGRGEVVAPGRGDVCDAGRVTLGVPATQAAMLNTVVKHAK